MEIHYLNTDQKEYNVAKTTNAMLLEQATFVNLLLSTRDPCTSFDSIIVGQARQKASTRHARSLLLYNPVDHHQRRQKLSNNPKIENEGI